MGRTLRLLLAGAMLAMPLPVMAQPATTGPAKVRFAPDVFFSPPASLDDVAFLEGEWRGEVFDMVVEHHILSPARGQMPGFVRIMTDEAVQVYEMASFIMADGSLTYRARQFTTDMIALQDRERFVDRPLVAKEGGTLYFDGMTFAPDGPDAMVVTFIAKNQMGEEYEQSVRYVRVGE
ncbi:DUF6265 family protein [Parvularcula sp. LCG005]|uniref:DUF6265 family protein n=1 Tax=Parvularcula sp. LCG005 TaxID=3078805 RepID=UPI00294364B4|nr:DUF6265 family protein [Parvularcula sp. LCG005]WOI54401.1 DUF6265 family protein [Parvularcula sp. LCG005]